MRAHLQQVEDSTGITPPELNLPEFPGLIGHVWRMFQDLNASRTGGGFGPSPITFQDLHAYMLVRGRRFRQYEVDTIKALDRLWFDVTAEVRKRG